MKSPYIFLVLVLLGIYVISYSHDTPGATLGWTGTQIHFFQLLNHKRFHKLALVSFLHLQKISIFAKFGGCGTKTKLATPISIFNFSRAWQSYFLS